MMLGTSAAKVLVPVAAVSPVCCTGLFELQTLLSVSVSTANVPVPPLLFPCHRHCSCATANVPVQLLTFLCRC